MLVRSKNTLEHADPAPRVRSQVVEVPYGERRFAATILLPTADGGVDLDALVAAAAVKPSLWEHWTHGMRSREVRSITPCPHTTPWVL